MKAQEICIGQLVTVVADKKTGAIPGQYVVLARTPVRACWWLQPADDVAMDHCRDTSVDQPDVYHDPALKYRGITATEELQNSRHVGLQQGFEAAHGSSLRLIDARPYVVTDGPVAA